MRILVALSFLFLSMTTLAQTPESYRHWDPLSRTGKRILSIRSEHAHIRPLSPFLEADAVDIQAGRRKSGQVVQEVVVESLCEICRVYFPASRTREPVRSAR